MKIEVRWHVDDGYVGKSRPQRFLIDASELQLFETEEEIRLYLYAEIEQEFRENITWAMDNADEVFAMWQLQKEALAGGESQ